MTRRKTAAVRVYPEGYSPSVVGMLWSDLAQLQTFFGGDAFLCYGIQMMPVVGGASDAGAAADSAASADSEVCSFFNKTKEYLAVLENVKLVDLIKQFPTTL